MNNERIFVENIRFHVNYAKVLPKKDGFHIYLDISEERINELIQKINSNYY